MTILEQVDPRYKPYDIKVTVKRLTGLDELHQANFVTSGKLSRQSLKDAYKTKHSTCRVVLFNVIMENIPTFVSVHFVRHQLGITHFVRSNRIDNNGDGTEDRYSKVTHQMLLNSESLMNIAQDRLCTKASFETQEVMNKIVEAVDACDSDLAINLVPKCVRLNGMCPEKNSCNLYKHVHDVFPDFYQQFKFNAFDNIKRCNCPPTKKEVI